MFYKETNFKETSVGQIPKDWEVIRLGDMLTYIKGKKPAEMIEKEPVEDKENYLPYLSAGYLRENKPTKFVKISKDIISVNEGDLILLWDGSNVGEFFLGKKGVLSSTMVKFELKEKKCIPRFLFYVLKNKEKYLKERTKGTGIPHVDGAVLKNLLIPLPSPPEQRRITETLSTVDLAIQKTNEIIAKAERLKKGLMQELLTKGIGHKEFKDTEIGRIPKDWGTMKLYDLIEIETGKRAKGGALNKGNVASIGGEHIDDQGNILWNDMKFIPEDFYDSLKQGKVKLGDVLLVKDGTPGKVAIIKNLKYEKVAVNEHVFIIRSKTDRLINEFLFYFLFSKLGQIQIKTRFHGLIGGIVRNDLETILLPVPPTHEQQSIVKILSTVDKMLELERNAKARLERIKQGLMDLLLTGKIRVKGEVT